MSRFVYGSLMAPEVLRSLLGRVPAQTRATVRGYHRFNVVDRVYPALFVSADRDERVEGSVLRGLSRRELAVLDWFEDEAYTLTRVEPVFESDEEDEGGSAAGASDRGAGQEEGDADEPPRGGWAEDAYLDERVTMAYVYLDNRHELYGTWDYDAFRREHLDAYVAMCEAFREDVKDNDLPGEEEEDAGEGAAEGGEPYDDDA